MQRDFTQELLEIFKSEAEDYLNILNGGLLELEHSENPETLEEIFRTTHSLKGAAQAVNFNGVEELCQAMESVFSRLKQKQIKITPPLLDILRQSVEHLEFLIKSDQPNLEADAGIINKLQLAQEGRLPDKPESSPKKKPFSKPKLPATAKEEPETTISQKSDSEQKKQSKVSPQDTIRVSFNRIDRLVNQSEELLTIKLKNEHYVKQIENLFDQLESLKQKLVDYFSLLQQLRTITVSKSDENRQLNNQVSELNNSFENNLQQLFSFEKNLVYLQSLMENDYFHISSLIDNHLTDIRQLLMFPFSTITNYIQKSTHTIARELNKRIDLKIIGSEIEMDKHVLEELKDPLIHLIRNSIDHGIEPPAERLLKGKPETGTITIEILPPREQKIIIKISDDGRGLDTEQIKKSALKKRLIDKSQLDQLSEPQILGLIFKSGFSTSKGISMISGRGLGMAVVAQNIGKLGGNVKIENYFPYGCAFLLSIPLSMTTSRGILTETRGFRSIIPTNVVESPLRIDRSQLKSVRNRDMVVIDGRNIPVFDLASLLSLNRDKTFYAEKLSLLILRQGEKRIAISVDRIIDEQEIILKNLNPPLHEIRFLAGATILGDGSLVPVLNAAYLFEITETHETPPIRKKKKRKKRILVAEDSITSRVLLKNLLETAGFEVQTTVNGAQAWELLKRTHFDLIISDVQMPKIDGFELTAKIRQDQKLKELPVILLTSLGSEEDRKKGLQVGANAYFAKSEFDQRTLLDIVQKLI
ncbi:MAG: hybrid sensor histidine kinase/response regulator [Calditrichaeota bacterium]|nr:hybrid sensor histidine kinase/response regulator [Calditrichota bacterium]